MCEELKYIAKIVQFRKTHISLDPPCPPGECCHSDPSAVKVRALRENVNFSVYVLVGTCI